MKIDLKRDTNQALGLGQFAVDFIVNGEGKPSDAVLNRTRQFFVDATVCGISALAHKTSAPLTLQKQALQYPMGKGGATLLGSILTHHPRYVAMAVASAVREWDSNGTNFGYNPELDRMAGEFGHNDYYGFVVAACQKMGHAGATALLAMVCLDEIRGRLAESFSLKDCKIDHVLHGAIATAAVWGALCGATPEQIECAIGMTVAHATPWRAIRAGKQLSDSKGASAAISAGMAVEFMELCMLNAGPHEGFVGPRDIFRNPEAPFRLFEGPGQMFAKVGSDPAQADTEKRYESPFDLTLTMAGDDFAVMGMHFKLGLYEHQSAGAIQAVTEMLAAHPELIADPEAIAAVLIRAYEPAFGIIGNPEKMDPKTRQSADHSMAYIVASVILKAQQCAADGRPITWANLMLLPEDYSYEALQDPARRAIMAKIMFEHGGPEYDAKYPEGIPTSVVITGGDQQKHDSGLVMFPIGHARNPEEGERDDLLEDKWAKLLLPVFEHDAVVRRTIEMLMGIGAFSAAELLGIYNFQIRLLPPIDLPQRA
ncbi:MmgE/PrpD family protein [bacterium]|nr:MmgE/PrpD family protein [bacterium]